MELEMLTLLSTLPTLCKTPMATSAMPALRAATTNCSWALSGFSLHTFAFDDFGRQHHFRALVFLNFNLKSWVRCRT
jgi:hypothetical protein